MISVRNIVVGYDGFERDERVPAAVVALARAHGARIHLVHVVPPPPRRSWGLGKLTPATLQAAAVAHRRRELDAVARRTARGLTVTADVRTGAVDDQLIAAARATAADLLVVTEPPRPGEPTPRFRANTRRLMRHSPCPVWAIRDPAPPRRVLATVALDDDGAAPRPIDDLVVDLAASVGGPRAQLVVLHAWDVPGEHLLRAYGGLPGGELEHLVGTTERAQRALVQQVVTEAADAAGKSPKVLLVKGSARTLIPEIARTAQSELVVLGTASRTGISSWFIGNTAEKVLNELPCSVLTVTPRWKPRRSKATGAKKAVRPRRRRER
ncbi:MAG: universal stress protein [Kofleriaceae bacterium]|nr:universal stress protein [Kofleriaceae bacterium]MCL4224559.1 universal stress protein [Myxococcales bacterium]